MFLQIIATSKDEKDKSSTLLVRASLCTIYGIMLAFGIGIISNELIRTHCATTITLRKNP